jgi:NADH-quinone oxidoreductase subunit N
MTPVTANDFIYQLPLIVLITCGLLMVLAESFFAGRHHARLMALTVAGGIVTAISAVVLYSKIGAADVPMMRGMLVANRTAYVLIALFALTTSFVAMISSAHQLEHDWESGEYYGLLLLSAGGMAMLAMAGDLVTVFIGIETMSLAVYALCASRRRSKRATEGALKYFLMGAFASGFLIYGMALVYGATGTTNLLQIRGGLGSWGGSPLLVVGMWMMIVAFGFKVAAVPFHMWAPDAYEGAPTPVTAYMAAAVKAATVIAMLVVFGGAFGGDVMPYGTMGWASAMAVLAAVTMTIGNIAALRQENVKRMLAYSSVSHGGVILCGLAALGLGAGAEAQTAIIYYLIAYSVTTVGAFAVVTWIGSRGNERTNVDDWNGLAASHPAAALAMTVCMLSFGGIPPTAGFLGKFYVFKSVASADDGQLMWLVIVGVLNSAISIFYYLRVVMAMYFKGQTDEFSPLRSGAIAFVMAVCALLVFEMGILPGYWLGLAGQ